MGRWIDFKNDYKTMYPWYMESIWWVFKQLYDKGLVYKCFKVSPFTFIESLWRSNQYYWKTWEINVRYTGKVTFTMSDYKIDVLEKVQ